MSAEDASIPYSRKNLEVLAQTLKMHRALVWINPITNNISLKHVGNFDQNKPESAQRN